MDNSFYNQHELMHHIHNPSWEEQLELTLCLQLIWMGNVACKIVDILVVVVVCVKDKDVSSLVVVFGKLGSPLCVGFLLLLVGVRSQYPLHNWRSWFVGWHNLPIFLRYLRFRQRKNCPIDFYHKLLQFELLVRTLVHLMFVSLRNEE